VDVPDEGQQVVVFVAQDGFVAIFKEMPSAAMAAVKVLSVPGEKFSHDGGDTLLAALEEEMDVTVHKYPGVDGAFPVDHVLAEPLKEQGFILVIFEDV
jgi:hypothetical protein